MARVSITGALGQIGTEPTAALSARHDADKVLEAFAQLHQPAN